MVKSEVSLDLVKCGMCGKAAVVAAGHRHVCEVCREEEHKLYSRVRALVHESPDVGYTIWEVSEILSVDESKIHHLVDSGFFTLTIRGIQIS